MSTILVTGYKGFELGIFHDNDQRVAIIKKLIEKDLIAYFENGVDWLVFMGNLGFESWVLDVANQLKEDYDIQLATIFPFENHGQHWNEVNQEKLEFFKQVDFVKFSFPAYENPGQLEQYYRFLIENTDEAYIFYDSENETKLKYLIQKIRKKEGYNVNYLTFDRLNEFLEEG